MEYNDTMNIERDILTLDELKRAIKKSIQENEMPEEAAMDLARHIMNFFGFNDRIIDNFLEPEDRDAFYMLEDAGILTTEREETTLYDGREWRIHYWLFRKDVVMKLIADENSQDTSSAEQEITSVYDYLPDDVWSRA
ncbi:MAG: DUF6015 family protein [Thermoplasmata archaeon]